MFYYSAFENENQLCTKCNQSILKVEVYKFLQYIKKALQFKNSVKHYIHNI